VKEDLLKKEYLYKSIHRLSGTGWVNEQEAAFTHKMDLSEYRAIVDSLKLKKKGTLTAKLRLFKAKITRPQIAYNPYCKGKV